MLSAKVNPCSAYHINEVTIVTRYQVFTLHLLENVAKVWVLVFLTLQLLLFVPACIHCFAQVFIELYLKRLVLIESVILRNLIKVCLLWSLLLIRFLTSKFLTNPDQLSTENI